MTLYVEVHPLAPEGWVLLVCHDCKVKGDVPALTSAMALLTGCTPGLEADFCGSSVAESLCVSRSWWSWTSPTTRSGALDK